VTHVFGVASCMWARAAAAAAAARGGVGGSSAAQQRQRQPAGEVELTTLARPPIRRISLGEVHTRSHTKLGSVPSSSLRHKRTLVITRKINTRQPAHETVKLSSDSCGHHDPPRQGFVLLLGLAAVAEHAKRDRRDGHSKAPPRAHHLDSRLDCAPILECELPKRDAKISSKL